MTAIQSRKDGEVVGATIRLPRALRDEVKIQAIRSGRSFNTHVVMILKEAAGAQFGDQTPAAETTRDTSHQAASHHARE